MIFELIKFLINENGDQNSRVSIKFLINENGD